MSLLNLPEEILCRIFEKLHPGDLRVVANIPCFSRIISSSEFKKIERRRRRKSVSMLLEKRPDRNELITQNFIQGGQIARRLVVNGGYMGSDFAAQVDTLRGLESQLKQSNLQRQMRRRKSPLELRNQNIILTPTAPVLAARLNQLEHSMRRTLLLCQFPRPEPFELAQKGMLGREEQLILCPGLKQHVVYFESLIKQ